MRLALSVEDTADLTPELKQKWDIHSCHFHIEKGGEQFDGDAITPQECWEYTETTGNLCHTSAVNIAECKKHFDELKKNYDKILHITISSGLSSGYQNAMAAAEGDPDIYVIDSKFTGSKITLLQLYAKQLAEEGKSFREICELVEERNNHIACSLIIDTLKYLYKGGRCSKLAALGANLLKLHPVIVPDKNGKFTTGKKYRGPMKKCVQNYINDLLESFPNIDKQRVFYEYANYDEETISMVKKMLEDFGFQEIYILQCGVINCYHAGPNACGIMFNYNI